MNKFLRLVDKRILLGGFPFGFSSNDEKDNVKLGPTKTRSKTLELILERKQKMTGKERLYYMFTVDDLGVIAPELNIVLQSTWLSCIVGAILGGFVRSKNAFMNFMQYNQASQFQNHMDAKRKLQDQVSIGFIKGAFQAAWRLSAFTGSYMLISTSYSVYRGKTGIVEHSLAGMITGAAYKSSLGVRGVIVGGTLGLVLGSICGACTSLILYLSGISMSELREMQLGMDFSRKEIMREALHEHRDQETPVVAFEHDERVGQLPLNLESLEKSLNNNHPPAADVQS